MARGKYLSLEEARKSKWLIKQFCDEHPSKGDAEAFEQTLDAMCRGAPPKSSEEAGQS
jgi:hypothetical protein